MRKFLILGFTAATLLTLTGSARAEFHPIKLLGRGFANILTAPLEIPKQTIISVKEGSEKTPHVSAWAFAGFFKGIAYTMGRMGSGMFDILTSNFNRNGDALMEPEYVFDGWPECKKAAAETPAAETAQPQNP